MSLSLPNSDYQNSEQFGDGRRPSGSRPMPVACRVCDRVFLDNVSLVLHFDSHVRNGIRLPGNGQASMTSGQHSSASWSPYSRPSLPRMNDARPLVFPPNSRPSLPRMNDARPLVFPPYSRPPLPRMNGARPVVFPPYSRPSLPRMNEARPVVLPPYSRPSFPRMNDARPVVFPRRGGYFRPYPPVNPTPRVHNHFYVPVVNISQVVNVSQPICHSIMGHYGATSSSGGRNFGCGPVAPPLLQFGRQNEGQPQIPNNIPPEIIILSDDEEDVKKSKTEIDLALKL